MYHRMKRMLAFLLAITMLASTAMAAPGALAADTQETAIPAAEPLALFQSADTRQTIDFNKDWKFHLGNLADAEKSAFDDSAWRKLNLPHDWSIEFDFNRNSPSGSDGGFLDGGIGWYRKNYVFPAEMNGKRISIQFDGVYMDSTVYVNGTMVGNYPSGYNAFTYDITNFVSADGVTENIIAVKVNNTQKSSRWYSGSGIYRDVTLSVTDPVHVALNGTYVTTPDLETQYAADRAVVSAETKVKNDSNTDAAVTVTTSILSADGTTFAAGVTTAPQTISSGATVKFAQSITTAKPQLWSTDTPNLYTLVTEVNVNGTVTDRYETTFGFRWFKFDPQNGFFLNGAYTKFRGVSMHHDQGALGAVSNDTAVERQMRMLKDMGVNAIRSTHNPASQDLLEICNRVGLMVIDEGFDCWWVAKTPNDYARFFERAATHPDAAPGETWGQFDIKSQVDYAKNEPCVVMWSLGNEIQQIEQAKCPEVATRLSNSIREVDNSRAITLGDSFIQYGPGFSNDHNNNEWKTNNLLGAVGFNYGSYTDYDAVHRNNPNWFIYSSETASAVSSRGIYAHPELDDHKAGHGDRQVSSYDNDSVPWGTTAHYALKNDRDREWAGGIFVWTGFDYIGEPTPYNSWPSKSSYFGIIDTAGFPKDSFYLYQSQWRTVEDLPMVHILPHWNWEGDTSITRDGKISVRTYSNAPSVELFLDGTSLGKQFFVQKTTNYGKAYQEDASGNLYLEWKVPFAAGELTAKAYDKDGKVIATDVVKTAGAPAALDLSADRQVITADGTDLSYITVDVVDNAGTLVPTADNRIEFSITGKGKIVGVDNGDATCIEPYQGKERSAFSGKALVIVQSTDRSGSFTVNAASGGLVKDSVTVYTAAPDAGGDTVLGYDPVAVKTTVNVAPVLPANVTAHYKNGTTAPLPVTWDAVPAAQLTKAGQFQVNGKVGNMLVSATVEVVDLVGAKPVSVLTAVGTIPSLPATVAVYSTDGSFVQKAVTWTAITADQVAAAGSFTVSGTITDFPSITATAQVRVASASTPVNVARASAGQEFPKPIASSTAGGDKLTELNDGIISYDNGAGHKNGWGNWAEGIPHATEWAGIEWATAQNVSAMSLYMLTNNDIYVPQTIQLQYWDGSKWADVAHQSKTTGFAAGSEQNITFDPVSTTKLRAFFTRGNQGSKSCMIVTEMQVFSRTLEAPHTTAKLASLSVDGSPLTGFAPDTMTYVVPLAFGAAVPAVTATAADHATLLVLPAISASAATTVLVTAEDGKTTRAYTVQFHEAPAAIRSAVIRLDSTNLVEDASVSAHVDATLENGSLADENTLEVTYHVLSEGTTAQAEFKGNTLMLNAPGDLKLQADITYLGSVVKTEVLSTTVSANAAKTTITGYANTKATTAKGSAPTLPAAVKATFNVGNPKNVAVTWDEIAPAQYAEYGTFTVSGTVAEQELKPTATVIVQDPVAARNLSQVVAKGVTPKLPAEATVYYNDGTSVLSPVVWDSYDKRLVSTLGTFVICGTAELGSLPVTMSVRVTSDVSQGENHAQTKSGFSMPMAMASFTNTRNAPAGPDSITHLNDGKANLSGDPKEIWCNWNDNGTDGTVWCGILFGVSMPESRFVDNAVLHFYNDADAPTKCTVEYYNKPITAADIPANGLVDWLDSPALTSHPFNQAANWTPVTNQTAPSYAKNAISTIDFDMVETYAIRVKMEYANPASCVTIAELQSFGKNPNQHSDFAVNLQADGAAVPGFTPGVLNYSVLATQDSHTVTATATNNAAVTILPAQGKFGTAKVMVTAEDGLKTETYTIRFTDKVTRVACVGDSITFGYESGDWQVTNADKYPTQLQTLLGDKYVVGNFGVNSQCMLSKGDQPYINQSKYTESKNFAPDAVVIMLGTNDAKAENWGVHKADYVTDALALIQSYKDLPSKPKVYIASSATVLAGDNIYNIPADVIHEQIVPLQKQIAQIAGCGFIDVHDATKNGTTAQFPDKVHGNRAGYAIIAKAVETGLKADPMPTAQQIISAEPITASTAVGQVPSLPAFVPVAYQGGGKGIAAVDWAISGANFAVPGVVTVNGSVQGLPAVTTSAAVTVVAIAPDAKNLALDRPATCSSQQTSGDSNFFHVFNGNDGTTETVWKATGNATQWFQVDLGAACNITGAAVSFPAATGGAYRYELQGSTDGNTFTTLAQRDTGATDVAQFRDVLAETTSARYLRLNVTGFVQNGSSRPVALSDFAVYGTRTDGDDAARLKIACVGDSITACINNNLTYGQGYPAKLNALLGDKYSVHNYGRSGASLLNSSALPYMEQPPYAQSLAWNPDYVIIMLGTNDSWPNNWADRENYRRDAEEMIRSYQNLPSKPEVIIATSSSTWDAELMYNLDNETVPMQRQIAKDLNLKLIDIHEATRNSKASYTDLVHPANEAGYQHIAQAMYDGFTNAPIAPVTPAPIDPTAMEQRSFGIPGQTKFQTPFLYRFFQPGNYRAQEETTYPLVVYLHDTDACGNDNALQVTTEAGKALMEHLLGADRQDYVLVAPQCPTGSDWTAQKTNLLNLISGTRRDYRIDPSRIYIVGSGVGGTAAAALAAENPYLFAAANNGVPTGDALMTLLTKVNPHVSETAAAPSITTQPQDQTTDGAAVTFSVTVPAPTSGTLQYQWQRQLPGSSTWDMVDFARQSSYSTKAVSKDMSGTKYRCIVTNVDGVRQTASVTSDAATLTYSRVINYANLALGMPATAIGSYGTDNPPSKAVDGAPGTDGNTDFWNRGAAGPGWWQVDLQDVYHIGEVTVSFAWSVNGTVHHKFNLQTSLDGTNWTTVTAYSDYDLASNPALKLVKLEANCNARYLKIADLNAQKDGAAQWIELGEVTAAGAPAVFTATVEEGLNGTIVFSPAAPNAGDTVTITSVLPNEGYELVANSLKVYQTGTPSKTLVLGDSEAGKTFVMPSHDVTITAQFQTQQLSGSLSITGTAAFGEVLTANTSAIVPADATITYAWTRAGTAEPVSTAATYTLVEADIGKIITLTVTWTAPGSGSLSASTDVVVKAHQSAPQGVAATQCTTADNNDGSLTGVTTAMEYCAQGSETWNACAETTVPNLIPCKYEVRYAATNTHAESLTVIVEVLANAALPKAEKPQAVFEASTMILSNVSAQMKYKIGEGEWTAITGETVDFSEANLVSGNTIKIYKLGDGSTTVDSDQQTIELTQAVQPTSVGKTDQTADARGTLTGVSAQMEYRSGNSGAWTAITGTSVAVEPGTYQVRVKGAGNVLASAAVSVTVAAYEAPILDKTAIDTAVRAAETAKSGISVSDSTPSAVSDGVPFVSTAVMAALNGAIETAKAAKDSVTNTQEVNAAAAALDDAVATFKAAIQTGTYVYYEDIVTKTEQNADGSTTKTITNKTTGTITETTTKPNGDKIMVETKKNGTRTEKITDKDGYRSETVTKPDGSFTSKVTDALGVKIDTNTSATGETTATVTLPKGIESAKVTVPAKAVTPGTVAVIVHSDGREEIIKTSVVIEGGLQFTVKGNVTVKLRDNSKRFLDVEHLYWAADAVQFVSSRELFNGTAKDLFSPTGDMSRAMLVTVLARLDGKDTSQGETWYSVSTVWAKENNISDGTALEKTISREQLAVMLYRYAKAEKTETDLKFSDMDAVSPWAVEAMNWAVARGIIVGKAGALDPKGSASRAEVATMLQRFVMQAAR